jgi:hypothetical protein
MTGNLRDCQDESEDYSGPWRSAARRLGGTGIRRCGGLRRLVGPMSCRHRARPLSRYRATLLRPSVERCGEKGPLFHAAGKT